MSVQDESSGEMPAVYPTTRGRTFPLNLGRLTAAIVARIAKGLSLPQAALQEEIRQMI